VRRFIRKHREQNGRVFNVLAKEIAIQPLPVPISKIRKGLVDFINAVVVTTIDQLFRFLSGINTASLT
jgi:hypothetical protein